MAAVRADQVNMSSSARNRVRRVAAAELAAEIRRTGEHCLTYLLNGKGVVTAAQFFNAVKAVFPLDPPLGDGSVWDALVDSMFGGLVDCPAGCIDIVWEHWTQMAREAPQDFEIAVGCLAQVANQLSNETVTGGKSFDVHVYIVG
jgi:hypothetical protein